MPSKTSRKAEAFVMGVRNEGCGRASLVPVLQIDAARGGGPLPQHVERRVVATHNSDCRPYTWNEFQAFFSDAAQHYWDRALRLPPSTVAAYPSLDESDSEELLPFAGLFLRDGRYLPGQVWLLGGFWRLVLPEVQFQPYPKRSQVTKRPSPRASLRRSMDIKFLVLIRLGLTSALAIVVLSW